MEDAGQQLVVPQPQQPLMTKLPPPGLTPSHGTTTLIHRSGHCYQLHRPHLALPPQPLAAEPGPRPAKLPRTERPAQQPASQPAPVPVQRQSRQSAAHHQHHHQQHHHHHHQQHHHQQHHQQQLQSRHERCAARQPAPPGQSHVSCLYPEILALIFSKLDVRDRGRAAQVCVAWREAAYQRSAWRGVEAKLHLRKHSSQVFQCLERRGIRKVQVLSLTMRRGLGDVFRGIPKLQSLNLSGCYNMSDAGLNSALGQAYPSLTSLNLSLCKNITDVSLGNIAQYLWNLESLELGGCGNVTNAGLQVIAWSLKKLKRLDLRSCWLVSDAGASYLADVNSVNNSIYVAFRSAFLPNPGCNEGGALKLEHLGLQDCQRLSDEGLRHIAQGLSGTLRSLNLSFCVLITDAGMKHVAKIGSLRELDLRSCDHISEAGMAYLAEGGSKISSLDVSFCDKIGDQALQHISQGLFNLKSLSLSACPITDEGISHIAKTQQDLETLHIGQCARLTDASVFTIVEKMPRLRCIDLYGCTRITKFGLEKIWKLPLVSLNLGLWQERR